VLAVLALVLLTGAVIKAGSLGWLAPLVESDSDGLVLLKMRSSTPMLPLGLLRRRWAMQENRAWVLLKSGRRLNLLDPSPTDWTDEDLALGLARTYRWGGHSAWELPLSVAQHSLTVLALRRALEHRPLSDAEALRELLHDAEEGLLS
jgi:hypothetical protein